MVEFGAAVCVPDHMMQPSLGKPPESCPDTLTEVLVHVGDEQVVGARYGIRAIPVRVFYESKDKEVFRHADFPPWPKPRSSSGGWVSISDARGKNESLFF
jgi:hypothetical protein